MREDTSYSISIRWNSAGQQTTRTLSTSENLEAFPQTAFNNTSLDGNLRATTIQHAS
jgi:hypothetical protein